MKREIIHWTDEEEEVLEKNYDKLALPALIRAVNKYGNNRTKDAIINKLKHMKLKCLFNEGLSSGQAAKLTGLKKDMLNRAIRRGALKLLNGQVKKTKGYFYEFSLEDLRDFLMNSYPYRPMNCIECKAEIIGDIYCTAHMPLSANPNPNKHETEMDIWAHSKDLRINVGRAIKKIRLQRNMNRVELYEKCHYSVRYIRKIEDGESELCLPVILSILSALGWSMNLKLEEKQKDLKGGRMVYPLK